MDGPGPLGEFLQARRARIRPEDIGVRDFGVRRRVQGLRRDEVAQLAGVSVSYYTRLEQGISRGASAEVLDAVARALRLDTHEREHLVRLADATRRAPRARRPRPEKVSAETRDLMRALDGVPTLVLGRRTDVLAWNQLGHALLAGHVDRTAVDDVANRPNMSRMMFLDRHSRELYSDWRRKARAVVGHLRIAVGRHPEDRDLAELIGELTIKSPDFVAMWGDHRITPCDAAAYDLHHPVIGAVTVTQQTLAIARSPEQSLIVVTTVAGSPSEQALTLLRSLGTPVHEPGAARGVPQLTITGDYENRSAAR
ncbi:helix-turn-helix domain-containing protein [Mycolicibacterium iranicum]|uniref:helix-turn-helix domain-containing protein n=1 Tax=Mycolicibacterium iranicum TaxID=912594 RepID=UPI000A1582B5|nr:helix-turn-helix transcriptional regulator [Mycolicibacterium iranicum]